jgi:hypothetical protein
VQEVVPWLQEVVSWLKRDRKNLEHKFLRIFFIFQGGLEVMPWSKRDLKNLPPDRTMLGRAYWTMLHSFSVYMQPKPNALELAAFKSIFDAIYHIFPCPVCRGHFRSFYHDDILQHELMNVETRHGAMLFAWKVHDVVTAWGVHRKQWPRSKLFPKDMDLNVSQFLMPWAGSDTHQIHIDRACQTAQPNCMTRSGGFDVINDIQGRWMIEGGIDQPLTDSFPAACDPPRPDQKLLKLDMFVMGKCPWCATALENLAGFIKCDYTCSYKGETLSARLDFNVHMVGLNAGTYDEPDLQTVHGPSELVGERIELCARQHYSKNYQFVRFLKCMDRNVTTVPLRAPECAEEADMDLDLLVTCANQAFVLRSSLYGDSYSKYTRALTF